MMIYLKDIVTACENGKPDKQGRMDFGSFEYAALSSEAVMQIDEDGNLGLVSCNQKDSHDVPLYYVRMHMDSGAVIEFDFKDFAAMLQMAYALMEKGEDLRSEEVLQFNTAGFIAPIHGQMPGRAPEAWDKVHSLLESAMSPPEEDE